MEGGQGGTATALSFGGSQMTWWGARYDESPAIRTMIAGRSEVSEEGDGGAGLGTLRGQGADDVGVAQLVGSP